jgi:osmotically-inducible protein OsmY
MNPETPESRKTDPDLREDVLCALAWDEELADQDIAVHVAHGVVTLAGVVDDWDAYRAAAAAAHGVTGVRDVVMEIKVRGASVDEPNDQDLASAVRRALEWDARLATHDIRSTVASGVVTLDGTVETAAERLDATFAIRGLHGVRRVENRLQVGRR